MSEIVGPDASLDHPLDEAERRALLDLALPAVFSTVAPDGSVHSVPVHYLFTDERFRFIAEDGSAKVRNARHSGRGTLCVTATVDGERRYVTAEGPVEIEERVVEVDLVALDRRYERESPSAEDEAYADTVTVVLHPERWLGRADAD